MRVTTSPAGETPNITSEHAQQASGCVASVYQRNGRGLLVRILLKAKSPSHAGHQKFHSYGVMSWPNLGGHKNCDQVANINMQT